MRRLWITFAALAALAGCNSGSIGSQCNGGPYDTSLCEQGAICTPARSATTSPGTAANPDRAYCRKTCTDESECTDTPGFDCLEVPGSMQRACQPGSSSTASDGGI